MRFWIALLLIPFSFLANGQDYFKDFTFTKADTLRGALNPARTCYDVVFYDLLIELDPEERFIKGSNKIHFTAIENFNKLQIDLFPEMSISKILYQGNELKFERNYNAINIAFPMVKKGLKSSFEVFFQ
ncbi:MAG: M1 family peptidase, partial [Bacteroidota bacterium]